ncbi:MAG: ribosome biogenesis GTP-binding protein YihA/YsxC [Vicinamibacterales bacterium]
MNIDSVEFVVSAARADDFPRDGAPEIALAGRSNVGKSSLLNALTGRRVARTSASPGKTRLANFYRVAPAGQPAFYIVDLPGYGYTDSREARAAFERVASVYFFGRGGQRREPRPPICGVILVIDARHPGLANDMAAFRWLSALSVSMLVVASKADKLGRAERAGRVAEAEKAFGGPVLPVSATSGENLNKLWSLIVTCLSQKPR